MADQSAEEKKGDEKEGKDLLGKLDPTKALAKVVEPPKPKQLEQGDYVINVHIIECRDLKGRGMGDMSDPVVEVRCMDQTKHTKILKKQLNPLFDEVMVYEFKNCYPEQIERAKVVIHVKDANTFRKDVLIGSFEFDVAQIYYREHHELYRQWCALSDVTDKHEGIQGYLKLSITVLGPKDEQHVHSAKEEDDDDGGMMGVLMPPEVEQHGKLLKVKVYSVIELPVMDEGLVGSKCDPYVQIEFAGIDIKTKHFKGQEIPDFQQELQIPVMEPVMSSAIKIAFWDWDAAGTNDRISQLRLDYHDIKDQGGNIPPKWYPFYGAPEGEQNSSMAKNMNKGFVPGTWYRGRALMSFHVEDNPEPKKDVVTCNGLFVNEKPAETQYTIQMDLYEGSEIPDKGKMHVELHCGKFMTKSEEQKVKEGRTEWYAPLKDLTFSSCKDVKQVPDVILYLCNGKKRVSYLRIPFADLVAKGWRVAPTWHILSEDKVLDELTDDEFPGALLLSMVAGPLEEVPDEPFPERRPLKYDILPEEPKDVKGGGGLDVKGGDLPTSPSYRRRADDDKVPTVGNLKLTVVSGHNLPGMDDGGKNSDPYCKIKIGDKSEKTKTIKKTLNPVWNQSFEFKDVSIDQQIIISAWDQDLASDDKMGEFITDIRSNQRAAKAVEGVDFAHEDRFFVSDKYPNAQIVLKFEFKYHELAKAQEIQKKITEKEVKESKSIFNKIINKAPKTTAGGVLGHPERKNYQLRAHIYQGKNLPALDSNGLSDPYVVLRFCGKKVRFSQKTKTLNPQWYESKYLAVVVPMPLIVSPRVQIFIFDHDDLGKDDPLGRFSVTCDEILKMNPTIHELKPKWFPLTDFEGKEIADAGILATFQLLTPNEAEQLGPVEKISIRPPTTPLFLEITTLGLRNLQSTLGIHKTFIDFELPNGKRFSTRPSKNPSPKYPNFLQVLKIPVDLPTNAIFSPTLNVEIRDVLFGGLVKRLIGASSLDMGKFMEEDEKGVWHPSKKKIELTSDADIEKEISEAGKKKAAEALKSAMKDAEKKAEEIKAKEASSAEKEKASSERKEEIKTEYVEEKKSPSKKQPKDELSKPLLSDDSDAHAIEVKDTGEGIGDIALGGGKEDINPLSEEDKKDFKDKGGPNDGDKYDPSKDAEEEDPEKELPAYMRGRAVIDDELEDSMALSPFHTIAIHTGQKNAGLLGQKWTRVGTFKGLVRLMEDKDEPALFDVKEMLTPQELYCRLYVLRGIGLTPKDSDGTSDPYLNIKCGKTRFTTRDRYCKDTLAPDFYERFEIPVTIPGDAIIEIECYDWDGIGDDLIGITQVDIEDRWFTKEWRLMQLKPLERRTLRSKSSTRSQGKLELWVELLTPEQAKKEPMWDIKPPPPEPYELRLIIWGTREITIKDETTNQNDLFVTAALSIKGAKKQETDTHWRSKKGKANFNWRMKWMIDLPQKPWPRLRFQIWDLDIFSPNDSICETVMTLKGICKRALKKKDRVKIYLNNKDRWWVENLRHPNFKGNQGRVEISLELMPASLASQLPAGFGRSDPNTNPFLPPPEGRVNWSLLHPFDMLKEILGPELYRKMCFGCCCMLFIAACVFMAPMIVSNVISNLLTP